MPKGKLLVISVFSFFILLVISFEVMTNGPLTALDGSINSIVPGLQTPFITKIANFIDNFLDTLPVLILSVLLSAYIFIKGYKKEAGLLAASMLLDAASIFIVKMIMHRPRPLNALVSAGDFSFPSGHSATAVVFFGIIAYIILENRTKGRYNFFVKFSAIILPLIIGLSRLYLNVHWFSDVIGGLFLGITILTCCIFAYENLSGHIEKRS